MYKKVILFLIFFSFCSFFQKNDTAVVSVVDTDKGKEAIAAGLEINEEKELGTDKETGEVVFLKNGPYGPYVQLGESTKRKAIPKGTKSEELEIQESMKNDRKLLKKPIF